MVLDEMWFQAWRVGPGQTKGVDIVTGIRLKGRLTAVQGRDASVASRQHHGTGLKNL